jgi:cytochrome b-561
MAYRIVLGSRTAKKAVHLLLHLLSLGFAAVGLYAAVKFHNDVGLAHIRSLHAWLGIATIGLYALQVPILIVCYSFKIVEKQYCSPTKLQCKISMFAVTLLCSKTSIHEFFSRETGRNTSFP